MSLLVRKVDNGYIITDNYEQENEVSYVVSDEGFTPVEAFQNVLYYVNTLIGPTTSRHDSQRIQVDIVPGDKYFEPEQEETDSIEDQEAEDLRQRSGAI